ncbi:tetratricopeptide repeat protein [Pacificibacter sp.]|uniref:tetratricopeptide repeat protein n=1 Tax=Pacificibacter sp. TaxID=1917866 RepID=UPI00321B4530
MAKIFLHIGHGKTGTSYLQSVFARNVEHLETTGIEYPGSRRFLRSAEAGETTSGNRAVFLSMLEKNLAGFESENSQLFSGEDLWQKFRDPSFCESVAAMSKRVSKPIELLFFIRDPIEMAQSTYLQNMQMRGEGLDSSSYWAGPAITQHKGHLTRIQQLIANCEKFGFNLTLHNYSRVRKTLLDHVAKFLLLPSAEALTIPARQVNRSIGAFEVGIIRGMSSAYEGLKLTENTNYIRRLVDATSEAKMPQPSPSADDIAGFERGVRPTADTLNLSLPPEAQYQWDYTPKPQIATPFTEDYGVELAREIARSTLLVMAESLDDAGCEVALKAVIENDLNPDISIMRRIVNLMMKRGAHQDALPVLQHIVAAEPLPEFLFPLATCYRKVKDFDAAIDVSQQLFAIDPNNEQNTSVLVNLLMAHRDLDTARATLSAATAAGLIPHKAYFLTHKLENVAGNTELALEALQAAVAADPENETYKKLLTDR